MDEQDEIFQFSDGTCFIDERLGRKMFIIKDAEPEITRTKEGLRYQWDEGGMADLFAQCYLEENRYCPERKSWYSYDNGVWEKDVQSLIVSRKILEFVRLLTLYCGEIQDDELRKKFFGFVNKMGDRRFRDRVLKDAAGCEELVIPASEFDKNPYLVNCKNGTYDLEHFEFREHDWRDFLTMRTNFEYTVQKVSFPRWNQFIAEVTSTDIDGKIPDPLKAEYLQKALGYSILGMANEECMFILHGKTTRNGKSTLLAAIQHLLGQYATTAPVTLITKSKLDKNAEAPSPVLAGLKGKRFVTLAESEDTGKLDESIIKQFTGGEEITARNLHEAAITFVPQFTLWLSCNDLPAVHDKSIFASDRLRVIEFNRHYRTAERDVTLKSLFETQEAMQGIFAWLVEGYRKYRDHGLKMNASMQKVVTQYAKDNDLILQFLEEKCERTDEGSIRAKTLFDNYKIWCKSNGFFVCSSKKFYAGLDTHPEWWTDKGLLHGYNTYCGLALKG